jgi:small subunit ribosomal protein S15
VIAADKKATLVKKHQRSDKDTGSPEVQVSIITARIAEITEHLKDNKHDFMARRGLLQLVGKRRRLLNYLAKTDPQAYLALVKELGLRK